MNKIFHPNINILGYIYLGILKDDWRSDYTIYTSKNFSRLSFDEHKITIKKARCR